MPIKDRTKKLKYQRDWYARHRHRVVADVARRKHTAYAGVCQNCGGPTVGESKGKAPVWCAKPACASAQRKAQWTPEGVHKEYQRLMAGWSDGTIKPTQELMNRMEGLRAKYKRLLVAEKLKTGDVAGALALYSSESIAAAIVEIAPKLTTDQLREIVRDEWTRCEAHRPVRAEFIEIFKRVGFVHDLDGSDGFEAKPLPPRLRGKTVTIYRGNLGEDEPDGISWTLSKATAQFFGRHHMSPRAKFILGTWREDGIPTVWSAQVNTKDVLAYFDGRNEKEVVVDPATLRNVKRIQEAR